jgi:hypothetical protein
MKLIAQYVRRWQQHAAWTRNTARCATDAQPQQPTTGPQAHCCPSTHVLGVTTPAYNPRTRAAASAPAASPAGAGAGGVRRNEEQPAPVPVGVTAH